MKADNLYITEDALEILENWDGNLLKPPSGWYFTDINFGEIEMSEEITMVGKENLLYERPND